MERLGTRPPMPFRLPYRSLCLLACLGSACGRGETSDDAGASQGAGRVEGQPGSPDLHPERRSAPSAEAGHAVDAGVRADAGAAASAGPLSKFPEQPAHDGLWFVVTSPAAGVYSEPSFERSAKVGWVRSGG